MGVMFEIIAEERMRTAVEKRWYNSEVRKKIEKKSTRLYSYLMKGGLPKEKWLQVDRIMSLYNHMSEEYGRMAYRQGFEDGIELIGEVWGVVK